MGGKEYRKKEQEKKEGRNWEKGGKKGNSFEKGKSRPVSKKDTREQRR